VRVPTEELLVRITSVVLTSSLSPHLTPRFPTEAAPSSSPSFLSQFVEHFQIPDQDNFHILLRDPSNQNILLDSEALNLACSTAMKDPFFLPPLPWLAKAAQPFADFFGLPSLPLHVHEVLYGCLFYSVIYYPVSPLLSKFLFPQKYGQLPRKRQLNWDAHVVSMVQATLINALALWVMFTDQERKEMDWEARVWGYTGAAGMVQGLAAGYFVWDLVVTSMNLDVFGIGTLAHAIAALFVFALGFVS
jgi:hypothetical protein